MINVPICTVLLTVLVLAWATVIHQSMADGEEGIRIRDIATHTSDSASAWVAFKLLWDRHVYLGTRRQRRKSYEYVYMLYSLGTIC
jgi:hypothetical protein